jgi:hypothetical protein
MNRGSLRAVLLSAVTRRCVRKRSAAAERFPVSRGHDSQQTAVALQRCFELLLLRPKPVVAKRQLQAGVAREREPSITATWLK